MTCMDFGFEKEDAAFGLFFGLGLDVNTAVRLIRVWLGREPVEWIMCRKLFFSHTHVSAQACRLALFFFFFFGYVCVGPAFCSCAVSAF